MNVPHQAKILPFRQPLRLKGIPCQFSPIPENVSAFWLHRLSRPQILTYHYICRRTLGYRKSRDSIALSQFSTGVRTRDGKILDEGVGYSKSTVLRALRDLESLGLLRRYTGRGKLTVYEPLYPLPLDD